MAEIAGILWSRLGNDAAKVPTRRIPTWLLKTLAVAVPRLGPLAREPGIRREPQLGKASRLLGWTTRPVEETIVDTARSLLPYVTR